MSKYSLGSGFYPIIVEPAASDRSTCKACNKTIPKGALRAQGVDFSERIRDLEEYGSDLDYGSGSDGYGIKKFWLHLECYDGEKHSNGFPYEKQYFKCQKFKGSNKGDFDAWLAARAGGAAAGGGGAKTGASPAAAKKKKAARKRDEDYEEKDDDKEEYTPAKKKGAKAKTR